jgi:hypothetical protein
MRIGLFKINKGEGYSYQPVLQIRTIFSGSGSDFSNRLGPGPNPSLYKIGANFFQLENFASKVAFKAYFLGKRS